MSDAPSVHVAMSRVMGDIGGVAKDSKNAQQGYSFRGIDAFMKAAQPAMIKHGVFVTPEVLERHAETKQTKSGGWSEHVVCHIRFTFWGPAGDSVQCITVGEAADSADKATNKCMSQALKYALMQVFCVPLESEKDPDGDTPEMGAPRQAPAAEPPPAVPAEVTEFRDAVKALCKEQGIVGVNRVASVGLAVMKHASGRLVQTATDLSLAEAKKGVEVVNAIRGTQLDLVDYKHQGFVVHLPGQEPFGLEPEDAA